MTRTLIALVLGVLLGVGATLLLSPSPRVTPQLPDWASREPETAPSTSSTAVPAAREASRDFYAQLAEADAAGLAALIAQAAARSPSADRELALAVLFKRYAELDAVRALRLARELRVGGTALGTVYAAWARRAPEQVLTALSTVESPADAAEVALAVIMALGDDANAVRRVAAVLAAREEETPAATGVLPQLTAFGPAGPVGFAPPRSALALAAQRWADLDPRRALAAAREISEERVRLAFETAALRTLARIAPDEAFAHLASLGPSALQLGTLGSTLVELARANPERMLNALKGLPSDTRRIAESAALQQLAERDPLAALRHLESMPPGGEREALLQVAARAYGRRDAAAALAWARQLRGQPMLVSAVIAGVAQEDFDRALDLALGLGSPMERVRAVQMVASTAARDDATIEAMAERLLAIDDAQMRDMVAPMIVSMWAARSPDGAMQWLLANGQSALPNAFQQIGQQLAMRDPQRAATYTAQVPEPAREQWVHGVVQGYAQNDPQGAIDWLGRFRGEEWYPRAATTLAMMVAQRDGAAAARLVEDLGADAGGASMPQLLSAIATNWANQDPARAADWSIGRATEQERNLAVRSALGVWASQDADAARQWTLRQTQGAVRDAALAAVLMASGGQRSGTLDPALLSAFTSPQAQQTAVLQIVQGLAYGDPAKARAIADAHLDPTFRAQADRMIESARSQSQPGQRAVELGVTQGMAPAIRTRGR